MSIAIQKRSRGVSVKRPSRSSAAAKATEWTSRSSFPSQSAGDLAEDALEILVGADVARGHELRADRDASSRTFASIRSPWNVNASSAPSSASRRAIAQAIERLFATPSTSARLPRRTVDDIAASLCYVVTAALVRRLVESSHSARRSSPLRPRLPPSADRAPRRRGRGPRVRAGKITVPDAHRRGRIDGHPHAVRAAARRLLPLALGRQLDAAAEPSSRAARAYVAKLQRAQQAGEGDAEARDPSRPCSGTTPCF